MLGTVNSPSLVMHQKQVVMQVNVAASSGLSRSSCDLSTLMISGVKGAHWGHLEDGGARHDAPSMVAFKVSASISQGQLCSMCQAWRPAV